MGVLDGAAMVLNGACDGEIMEGDENMKRRKERKHENDYRMYNAKIREDNF